MVKPTAERPPPEKEAEEPLKSSSMVTVIKGLLLVCALQFFVLSYFVYQKKSRQPDPARPSGVVSIATRANAPDQYQMGKPGPWGELEHVRINIVSPDDFLPAQASNLPQTEWRFGGYTGEKLAGFFQTCALTPEQKAELLNPAIWSATADMMLLRPGEKLVLGLSPEARSQIYTVLAEIPGNDFQNWPFTFRRDGFDEWFQNSGVSGRNQALIKKLTYQRGQTLCFSDLREVLAQDDDEAQHKLIVRALSRRTGLLVKLRVRPDTKLEELTEYWAKGGRAKDIGALLESLAKVQGGTSVDIAHLLPSFARSRLNTFPKPEGTAGQPQPDCYWTAMNFFKNPPDAPYEDDAVWRKELAANYEQVVTPTFGDLLFLVRPDGVPKHAAVYIADDIVFTKNGGNHRQPWLLMKVDDMLARYPSSQPLSLVVFKLKRGSN